MCFSPTNASHTLNVTNRHYKGTESKDSHQADPTVKENA